jgi:arabinogalactan oligomer/maltooligosaccharide transport system substrate-binding protein
VKKSVSIILAVVFLLTLVIAGCSRDSGKQSDSTTPADSGQQTGQGSTGEQDTETAAEDKAKEIQPEEGAKLVLWESGGVIGEWAKYVAEEFTKRYGIPVVYEHVENSDAPHKMKTDGPAGVGADVFAAPHDHLGGMVSAGLILENFFAEEYIDNYLDAAITGTTMNGVLYGYPTAIETYALFYNKDLVEKLPETWEELIEQAKSFTDIDKNMYGFMMEPANFYYVYSFIGGYGGYVFGDNNTNPNDIGLNSEGAIKGCNFLRRIREEILPLKSGDITYDVKEGLFKEGRVLFNMNGPWAVGDYRQAGLNFGVMPLPLLDNGTHPTSFSGIRAFYVNAYTKYPNAASLLAKFASSEEMQKKFYEMAGMVPVHKNLLEDPDIKGNEITSAFMEQAKYSVPMPNIPQMQLVWSPMSSALAVIWDGQLEVKEALDAAVEQLKSAIASQGVAE